MARRARLLASSLTLLLSMCVAVGAETTFDIAAGASAYLGIADIRMYYETYGQGEPLLLLSPAEIGICSGQARALSDDPNVIAPELRGHWPTIDFAAPLSYQRMADDVVLLLDRLAVRAAFVAGCDRLLPKACGTVPRSRTHNA